MAGFQTRRGRSRPVRQRRASVRLSFHGNLLPRNAGIFHKSLRPAGDRVSPRHTRCALAGGRRQRNALPKSLRPRRNSDGGPAENGLNVRKKGGPLTMNFVVPKPPARRAILEDVGLEIAVTSKPPARRAIFSKTENKYGVASKPPARRAIGASCGNVPAFQRITSKKVSGTSFSGSLSNSLIRNPFLRQLFYEAKEARNSSPGFSLWRSACRKTFPFRRPCRGRGTAHRLSACGTGRGFPRAARFMAGRFAFTFRGRLPILQPILNPFRTRFLMSRVRRLFSGMT